MRKIWVSACSSRAASIRSRASSCGGEKSAARSSPARRWCWCREWLGCAGRMDQLPGLGHELDVDQRARRIFEVPDIAAGILRGDFLSHLARVGRMRWRLARRGQAGVAISVSTRAHNFSCARHQPRPRQRHMLPGPAFAWRDNRRRISKLTAAGPLLPLGRSRMSTSYKRARRGGRGERRDQPLRQPRKIKRGRQFLFAIRTLHALRHVIDEHQIEIGAGGHFPSAQLAQRDHGEFGARHAPGAYGKLGFHHGEKPRDHAFGDAGKAGPARSAWAASLTNCTPTRKLSSRAKRRAPSSALRKRRSS